MTHLALFVTFDTNTYSNIANPQPRRLLQKWWPLTRDRWKSKKQRVAWWYLARCIKTGRIVAGIPEALLATEALPKVSRVQLILAVGTKAPRPPIPQVRNELIAKALRLGFRVMGMPRIGHPSLYPVKRGDKAVDARYTLADRIQRSHQFGRHFNNYALEAVRDFGEALAKAHNLSSPAATLATPFSGITTYRDLWREGLAAEEGAPRMYASPKYFASSLRHRLADWTDFDVASAHFGYGYDYLCTEDLGSQSSNSIFGPQHNTTSFGICSVTAIELAQMALKRFWFPVLKWSRPEPV
jgi:hypothetical protein